MYRCTVGTKLWLYVPLYRRNKGVAICTVVVGLSEDEI